MKQKTNNSNIFVTNAINVPIFSFLMLTTTYKLGEKFDTCVCKKYRHNSMPTGCVFQILPTGNASLFKDSGNESGPVTHHCAAVFVFLERIDVGVHVALGDGVTRLASRQRSGLFAPKKAVSLKMALSLQTRPTGAVRANQTPPPGWVGSIQSTFCGFSTGSMARLTATASPSLLHSTHSSGSVGLALIS